MARRAMILVPILLLVLVGLFFMVRPDASDSGASSAEEQRETLDVEIEEGEMVPETVTVDEGDRVSLRVTSDTPAELHMHGYDAEAEVEPGEPAEVSLDATDSGRFEIEDHHSEAVLGELRVQPR